MQCCMLKNGLSYARGIGTHLSLTMSLILREDAASLDHEHVETMLWLLVCKRWKTVKMAEPS